MSERTPGGPSGLGSIRAKLLAYALAFLVVPTALYGIFAFQTARGALGPVREDLLRANVLLAARSLRQILDADARDVSTWARLGLMRELVVKDIDKTISQFLAEARYEHPTYLDLLAIDLDGICVASSSPAFLGRPFDSGSQGDASAPGSALGYSAHHEAFYVALRAPIPDPDDPAHRLGTLLALLNLDSLRTALRVDEQPNVQLRLLSRTDRLLAGPETPPRSASLPVWRMTPTGDRGSPMSRKNVYHATSPDGGEILVSEAPVEVTLLGQPIRWRVIASVSLERELAPIRAVRDRILLIGSLLTAVGVIAAWILSTNLSRPLRALTGITSRIAEEGVLHRIPEPVTNDEIGELTRSFQKMVANIAVAHEELVQSAKLAFLGELATGIAHEIRTPLGIIKNSAQLLARRMKAAGSEENAEFAQFIYEESDRLNAVVNDILRYARPSPLETVPTDVSDIARRAVQFLEAEAGGKRVTVDAEGCSIPQIANCDGPQIYQVCLNLIMNAIRACPEAGRVEVSTALVDGRVEISVADDGPGIAPELHENLFEPFVSQQQGGIGLGLAIVKRIVTAHGGSVDAWNRPSGGAVFCMRIPVEPQRRGTQA